eukprot:1148577-Pelagomonas_calceolata.AAC.6
MHASLLSRMQQGCTQRGTPYMVGVFWTRTAQAGTRLSEESGASPKECYKEGCSPYWGSPALPAQVPTPASNYAIRVSGGCSRLTVGGLRG